MKYHTARPKGPWLKRHLALTCHTLTLLAWAMLHTPATAQINTVLNKEEFHLIEAFEAPGAIFHPFLCKPAQPETDGYSRCTTYPLDWNKPFTRFPVLVRVFDGVIQNPDDASPLRGPNFIIQAAGHGVARTGENGDVDVRYAELNEIPTLQPNEHYFYKLVTTRALGESANHLNLWFKLTVPKGTTLYTEKAMNIARGPYEWVKCADQNASSVQGRGESGGSHTYASLKPCPMRYTVHHQEGTQPSVSYVWQQEYRLSQVITTVSRAFKVSPKDPPGLYGIEVWFAGKLLIKTRYRVGK